MKTNEYIPLQAFTLFHALVRHDETPEEASRSKMACEWMLDNTVVIRRFLPNSHCEVIGYAYEFFRNHGSAPSMDVIKLEDLDEYSETLDAFLEEYKNLVTGHLPLMRTKAEMDNVFKRLVRAVQAQGISRASLTATQIAMAGREGVKTISPVTRKEETYKGTDGARRYLAQAMYSPIHQDPFLRRTRVHKPGDWRDDLHEAIDELMEAPAERIYTHIQAIDNAVAIRKGELVGILGYTGSGKSRLGRTISYNAMLSGRNVLHIVTEGGGRKVERIRYAVAHAHHLDPARAKGLGITFKAHADGVLTPEGLAFLEEAILDLSKQAGGITVVSPSERSWEGVKSIIEGEAWKRKADLVYIDYLTHLVPPSSRDPRAAMSAIIHEAQNLAAVYDNGNGLALMTPVQGNRAGYDAAKKAGGVWGSEGLYEYSTFGMDCDLLLTVFSDDDLKDLNQIIVGTAKARSSAGMTCSTLNVHRHTQMIWNPEPKDEAIDASYDSIEDWG